VDALPYRDRPGRRHTRGVPGNADGEMFNLLVLVRDLRHRQREGGFYQQLAQLYGLTPAQVNWLRTFANENHFIITVRSRAAQAIKFLEEGAVLKPEQIKIKSVSWLDAQYLGYRQSNIGMVVPRSPISKEQLTANLIKGGVKEGSARWDDAFKLLGQRVSEFDHAPGGFTSGSGGYYKDLETAGKEGKITLRWNVEDNSVNPDVATNTYTEYNFRLHDDGDGNYLPQFQFEAGGPCVPPACMPGGWRSVTGDIDFLSMTNVNGRGLSAAKRVELYQKLAGKNPGHMLHPAADTWTIGDDSGSTLRKMSSPSRDRPPVQPDGFHAHRRQVRPGGLVLRVR
jgi:hypothetical protein